LRENIQLDPLGAVTFRGKAQPVDVFSIKLGQ
jgi:hypothetical protein